MKAHRIPQTVEIPDLRPSESDWNSELHKKWFELLFPTLKFLEAVRDVFFTTHKRMLGERLENWLEWDRGKSKNVKETALVKTLYEPKPLMSWNRGELDEITNPTTETWKQTLKEQIKCVEQAWPQKMAEENIQAQKRPYTLELKTAHHPPPYQFKWTLGRGIDGSEIGGIVVHSLSYDVKGHPLRTFEGAYMWESTE